LSALASVQRLQVPSALGCHRHVFVSQRGDDTIIKPSRLPLDRAIPKQITAFGPASKIQSICFFQIFKERLTFIRDQESERMDQSQNDPLIMAC